MAVFFFDSHGDLHVSCSAEHPKAAAFGPTGVSRPAELWEANMPWECELNGQTPHAHAAVVGRLERAKEAHEWDILVDWPRRPRPVHPALVWYRKAKEVLDELTSAVKALDEMVHPVLVSEREVETKIMEVLYLVHKVQEYTTKGALVVSTIYVNEEHQALEDARMASQAREIATKALLRGLCR
jgi:hypothetical protein